METTRSERIKLGAFMLLCGILICVFLGYVLKRYLSEQYDNYYTIFDTSVNGLFVDAKVKLNGIDVGSVTLALTPMFGPTALRINSIACVVAPPLEKPVEVFT